MHKVETQILPMKSSIVFEILTLFHEDLFDSDDQKSLGYSG